MAIHVESGYANENFVPKGKSKKDTRIGNWDDYTFEFILTYKQSEDLINEYYEHLLIFSTGKYTDGKKDGNWKFYAIEAETMKRIHIANVNYINDKKEGAAIYYYSSGEKAAVGTFQNDLLQGEFTTYFKTGEIARISNLVDDQIEGELIFKYMSGETKAVYNYINGLKSGVYLTYYKNGAIKSTKHYVSDTLVGPGIQYYPNGKIQEEAMFEQGKISHLKYYYESGQLWVSKVYQDGKYFNVLELYNSEGNPLDFGTLKDGTGTVKYYTDDAKVYLIRTFEDGVIMNEEKF